MPRRMHSSRENNERNDETSSSSSSSSDVSRLNISNTRGLQQTQQQQHHHQTQQQQQQQVLLLQTLAASGSRHQVHPMIRCSLPQARGPSTGRKRELTGPSPLFFPAPVAAAALLLLPLLRQRGSCCSLCCRGFSVHMPPSSSSLLDRNLLQLCFSATGRDGRGPQHPLALFAPRAPSSGFQGPPTTKIRKRM